MRNWTTINMCKDVTNCSTSSLEAMFSLVIHYYLILHDACLSGQAIGFITVVMSLWEKKKCTSVNFPKLNQALKFTIPILTNFTATFKT